MSTLALVATRKGLFQITKDLVIEPLAFIGDPVTMVLTNKTNGDWFAALNLGHFGVKLHHSSDSGINWTEIGVPSYPSEANPEKGDSLDLIWSLEFAEPGNANKLWAGTIPGGLFYSDNKGKTWQLNQPLWQLKQEHNWAGGGYDQPGIHSICVDPRDHRAIRVGVSVGGVWCTLDNGKSWSNVAKGMRAEYMPPDMAYDPHIQDPHRVVQCSGSPDHFWSQHHNGIFSSNDSCEKWVEFEGLKPSSFGFGVAVHPQDPKTAWFAPGVKDECRIPIDAKLVVLRTKDGGQSFESLSDGLPSISSYDLVYRHALEVDSTGEKLLMGSTTGNLWISENQGNTWSCLSNYLPPIYAVRFVS